MPRRDPRLARRARSFVRALGAAGLAAVVACASAPAPAPPRPPPARGDDEPTTALVEPPSYVLSDGPAAARVPLVALDRPGETGAMVDGVRLVVRRGEVRSRAAEVTSPGLAGIGKVPPSLGGGFVAWGGDSVYGARAYDGALVPLATLPVGVSRVEVGAGLALVSASSGERFALRLPRGERTKLPIPGAVDVAVSPDGRVGAALAFDGRAGITLDGGSSYRDVTGSLAGPVDFLVSEADGPWFVLADATAVRVEPDGRLTRFPKALTRDKLVLRPADPRWRGASPPLRSAVLRGAPLDATTALVIAAGDLVRVDLRSGALVTHDAGRFPPTAQCEPWAADGSFVVVCVGGQGTDKAMVYGGASGDKAAVVEHVFHGDGVFEGGDEGALLYTGPCDEARPGAHVVCVRQRGGGWLPVDLAASADAGAPVPATDPVRWVPSADGGAFALFAGSSPGVLDTRTGLFRAVPADRASVLQEAHASPARAPSGDQPLVDRAWAATSGGTLRGYGARSAVEIDRDGAVRVSPFVFDRLSNAGASALGRTREGRLFQTADRGATWSEIAGPPTGRERSNLDVHCGAVGCEVGAFLRLGYRAEAPTLLEPPTVAPAPPLLPPAALPRLSCAPTGDRKVRSVLSSEGALEGVWLGVERVAPPEPSSDAAWLYGTALPSAGNGGAVADGDGAFLRLVVAGPTLMLGGASPPSGVKRALAWSPPFAPFAPARRTDVGFAELVAAGVRAGKARDEVATDELLSFDGAPAPGGEGIDYGLPAGAGLFVLVGPAGRRLLARPSLEEPVVSVVGTPDGPVLLEVDADGGLRVARATATGGLTDLFGVPRTSTTFAVGQMPHALGVGGTGEVFVVRAASSGEAPTDDDPAMLLGRAERPAALAPFAAARLGDDPGCRVDPRGPEARHQVRVTLAVPRPWLAGAGAGLEVEPGATMLLRARWSPTRLCIDGLEVRVKDVNVRVTSAGVRASLPPLESRIVLRAGPQGVEAARVAIGAGFDVREPLACSLGPPSP